VRREPKPRRAEGDDESVWNKASPDPFPPQADPAAGPPVRHLCSSAHGGWSLVGRLIIWAMRNSGTGAP
jgi:hypothetical protein